MKNTDLPYTKFPNAALERLPSWGLNKTEMCVFLAVARLAWGYHQNGAVIKTSEIAALTDASLSRVRDAVASLIRLGILYRPAGTRGRLGITKVESWSQKINDPIEGQSKGLPNTPLTTLYGVVSESDYQPSSGPLMSVNNPTRGC